MLNRALVLGMVATLATGCFNSAMQRAETLGKGNFEFAVEPGIQGFGGSGTGVFGPSFNLAGRFGVSDRVDLGARLGTSAIELQSKFMLSNPDSDLKLSIAPYVTPAVFGGSGGAAGFLRAKVPLLIGVSAGANNQLVIGPSVGVVAAVGSSGGTSAGGGFLYPGASLGYSAQVGDSVRLHPELGVDVPLVAFASGGGDSVAGIGTGGVVYSVALGIQFGNGYSK